MDMRHLQSRIGWCARARAAMAVLLVLGALAFYLLGYRPGMAMLHRLQAMSDAHRAELSRNQEKLLLLPAVRADVTQLKGSVADFQRKLSKQSDSYSFDTDVNELAQRLSLRKLDYTPKDLKRGAVDSLNEKIVSINFEGDFYNTYSFLRQLDEMQRLTRVRSLKITSKDAASGLVAVEMTLSVYFQEQ